MIISMVQLQNKGELWKLLHLLGLELVLYC